MEGIPVKRVAPREFRFFVPETLAAEIRVDPLLAGQEPGTAGQETGTAGRSHAWPNFPFSLEFQNDCDKVK